VELQIKVAEGNELGLRQEEITMTGHAIECRIYAEDPENNFSPSAGTILGWKRPEHARTDSGIDKLSEVLTSFDPMLAKIIVHGRDRDETVREMSHALKHTAVLGIATNTDFLSDFIADEMFQSGKIKTDYFDSS